MDPDRRIAAPPLSGDPPSSIYPAPGCRFASRCPFTEEVCRAVTPELVSHDVENGKGDDMSYAVACHMADPGSAHSKAGRA